MIEHDQHASNVWKEKHGTGTRKTSSGSLRTTYDVVSVVTVIRHALECSLTTNVWQRGRQKVADMLR